MGRTRTAGATPPIGDKSQRDRFAEYFPRVFAYVHSTVGDDVCCKQIVVEAFARVFDRGDLLGDVDFPVALFSVTRDLCEGSRDGSSGDGSALSNSEREVLSLLFDAQLTRGEVGSLLQLGEDRVTSTLVQGLKKLRDVVSRDSNPAPQHYS